MRSPDDETTAGLRDPRRLAELRRSALLDSPPEEPFDRLTRLASRVLHAPVSLVSLVGAERVFFKSSAGLAEPWASRRETPLTHSICPYVVAAGEPLVIEDAREHELVRDSLATPELGVVAYAGIPLVTRAGDALGSFCAIDSRPRRWTEEEVEILRDLASLATTEIEMRLLAAEASRESALLVSVLDQSPHGVIVSDAEGRLVRANDAAVRIWGGWSEAESVADWGAFRAFHPDGTPFEGRDWAMARCLESGEVVDAEAFHIQRFDGTFGWLVGSAAPLRGEGGELVGAVSVFVDVTVMKEVEAANQRRALEINDDVVQSVTAARMAFELDREEEVRESLAAALAAARKVVNDLLSDDVEEGALRPGGLRRREPAAAE